MLHPEITALITSDDDILEPETLRQFHPELSEAEVNQVLAFTALRKTRGFWENMNIFEDIVQALNGIIPNPKVLQGARPEQIWYALDIAHNMYPEREYSIEVLKYIEFIFNEIGVYIFPGYLPIDNPYFSKVVSLANNGPFPLGEDTVEEIQAAKFLAIQEYLKQQKKKE
jgi:hypothetical protein